jgi:acyl-CoA dehydrogenase
MSDWIALVADASEKLFSGLGNADAWRAAERGEGFADLWAIEASGFLDVLVEGDASMAERGRAAHAVIKSAGKHLLPAPIGETICARFVLGQHNLAAPEGPLVLALRGETQRASYGRYASAVVLWRDGHIEVHDAKGAVVQKDVNLALEPRDALSFKGIPLASKPTALNPLDVEALCAAIRSTQMAGALERVLLQTIDYATTRKQFGKPIGQFQAIQQALAAMAGHVAAADAASEYAWRQLGTPAFWRAAATAKIRCGEAAGAAIAIAHQTHGAIGITEEHDLHFATRRLISWRSEAGAEAAWSERLGRHAAALGPEGLWAEVTR